MHDEKGLGVRLLTLLQHDVIWSIGELVAIVADLRWHILWFTNLIGLYVMMSYLIRLFIL